MAKTKTFFFVVCKYMAFVFVCPFGWTSLKDNYDNKISNNKQRFEAFTHGHMGTCHTICACQANAHCRLAVEVTDGSTQGIGVAQGFCVATVFCKLYILYCVTAVAN